MAREFGFTPEQVGNLTLGEVAALMEDPEGHSSNESDIDEHGRWWASLTPEERLKNAQRSW
jgi:hypothetical protein